MRRNGSQRRPANAAAEQLRAPARQHSQAYGPDVTIVPSTLDDIDVAWLRDALGMAIDAVDVVPIAVGEGFMGQLARVRVHSTDPNAPRSVIVKLPTADPGARFIGEMMRVWEREHCFCQSRLRRVRYTPRVVELSEGTSPSTWHRRERPIPPQLPCTRRSGSDARPTRTQ